jgi:deoxyribonuclease V
MAATEENELDVLRRTQRHISKRVILEDPPGQIASIGAVAQSSAGGCIFSSAVVVDSQMSVIDESSSVAEACVPYVPGFLFFREGPVLMAAVEKLRIRPDALIIHGCGINHPQFAGFASHVGVLLQLSTIGVSKRPLCGEYAEPRLPGSFTTLTSEGKLLGFVLKTGINIKPIFVSPGNRMSLFGALHLVKRCTRQHRLPEPLRLAHVKARHLRSTKFT